MSANRIISRGESSVATGSLRNYRYVIRGSSQLTTAPTSQAAADLPCLTASPSGAMARHLTLLQIMRLKAKTAKTLSPIKKDLPEADKNLPADFMSQDFRRWLRRIHRAESTLIPHQGVAGSLAREVTKIKDAVHTLLHRQVRLMRRELFLTSPASKNDSIYAEKLDSLNKTLARMGVSERDSPRKYIYETLIYIRKERKTKVHLAIAQEEFERLKSEVRRALKGDPLKPKLINVISILIAGLFKLAPEQRDKLATDHYDLVKLARKTILSWNCEYNLGLSKEIQNYESWAISAIGNAILKDELKKSWKPII